MDESFYRDLLENLADGIYFVDPERKITFWNRSAEQLTGFIREEVVGRHCHDNILNHVDLEGNQLCKTMCPLARTLQDGKNRSASVYLQHKDGHRLPVSIRISPIINGDRIIGAVESFSDSSSQIASLQRIEHLEKENLTDQTTGIGNRRYAEHTLTARLEETTRYNWRFGFLFIDADHFKQVNDRYGHTAGDMVLKSIAGILSQNLRSFDFIGRWGGEEFIILLINLDSEEAITEIANRLRMLVEKSFFTYRENRFGVTVSMGATVSNPEDTIDSLVNRGDRAMYASKRNGRNRVTFQL